MKTILYLGLSSLASVWSAPLLADPSLCQKAQELVENFEQDQLLEYTKVINYEIFSEFTASKPKISDNTIELGAFTPKGLENQGSIYCKFKTQEAIEKKLSIAPRGEPQSCNLVNISMFNDALNQAEPAVREAYLASPVKVVFSDDVKHIRGDRWLRSKVSISTETPGEIRVRASTLRSASWIPRIGGMRYCKILNKQGVSQLIDQAIELGGTDTESDEDVASFTTKIDSLNTDIYFPKNIEESIMRSEATPPSE